VKKKKKPSLSRLKKNAWKQFSEYVRKKSADKDGFVSCITCGVKKHWKELHASHLVPGRGNSILFDERGVYPACYACNIHKHGNLLAYIDFMILKHGATEAWLIIEDLKNLSRLPKKFTIEELENLLEKYRSKNSQKATS